MPKLFSSSAKSKVEPKDHQAPTLDEVKEQHRRLELYGIKAEESKADDKDLEARLKKKGLM